jgi:PEP-CTERM motif
MTAMKKNLFAAGMLLALLPAAQAQISVGSSSFSYTQSFDSLTTSTTATPWVNDSTLPGWSLINSAGAAAATIVAGTGSSNAGSFYSFGAAGNAERALGGAASGGAYFGSPASGAIAGWMVVAFTNNTNASLDGFSFGYDGEQWRNGGNTSAQTMVMEFGIGSSFAGVTSWTAPGGNADFTSPVVGSTAAAVDGNVAGLVTGRGGSYTGLNWAAGDTLYVRFVERNDTGNDHGLALDNFSFSVTAVPEPGTVALWLAGLAAIAFVSRRRG